jgi:hypothetical protein
MGSEWGGDNVGIFLIDDGAKVEVIGSAALPGGKRIDFNYANNATFNWSANVTGSVDVNTQGDPLVLFGDHSTGGNNGNVVNIKGGSITNTHANGLAIEARYVDAIIDGNVNISGGLYGLYVMDSDLAIESGTGTIKGGKAAVIVEWDIDLDPGISVFGYDSGTYNVTSKIERDDFFDTLFNFTSFVNASTDELLTNIQFRSDFDVPPTGIPGITGYMWAMIILLLMSAGLWGYIIRRRLNRGANG